MSDARIRRLEMVLREERERREAAEAALAALAKREGMALDCRTTTTLESLAARVAPASVSLFPETLAVLIAEARWVTQLQAEVARLRAENAELAGVLQSVEWFGDTGDDRWYSCPSCGQHQPRHAPGCALAAALREVSDDR